MMHLSSDYEAEFRIMLESTAQWKDDSGTELTSFWPLAGGLYQPGGLLVVGRAVNSWSGSFLARDAAKAGFPEERVSSLRQDELRADPMEWLGKALTGNDKYSARRSAFWSLAEAVARHIRPDLKPLDPWWSHIAWTNLAKVSPAAGGNPSDSLWKLHLDHLKGLLKMELDEFKPGALLIVTDYWFDPFTSIEGFSFSQHAPNEFVQRMGRYGVAPVLVTKRPERKKRSLVAQQTIDALVRMQ